MNHEQYKRKIIEHFKSGTASTEDWELLAQIFLVASHSCHPDTIDDFERRLLTEDEYKYFVALI